MFTYIGIHHQRSLARDIELRRIVRTAYENVGFSEDDIESLQVDERTGSAESIGQLPDPVEIPTVGRMQHVTTEGPPSSTGAVHSMENLGFNPDFSRSTGRHVPIVREGRRRHAAASQEQSPLQNVGGGVGGGNRRKYGTNISPIPPSQHASSPAAPQFQIFEEM